MRFQTSNERNLQFYVRNVRFINLQKYSQKYRCQHRSFSLEGPAGGSRSGQLFMVGCIRGGYKRRLLQTLNSPYINQTANSMRGPSRERERE